MSGNTEINISTLPAMNYKRSKFKYYKNYKTTFNCGDLICTYANELVQPGDTFKMDVSLVARMSTPYQAVMDNAYLETWAFKILWLDVWDNCKEFWGENPNGAWTTNQVEWSTPQIKVPAGSTVARHTLLDYLGWPRHAMTNDLVSAGGLSINSYIFVYNEWFRNQNYIAPIAINRAGTTVTYDPTDITKGGQVLKVMKPHTRFTAGLPEPQKSPTGAIAIPLGTTAPVKGTGITLGLTNGTDLLGPTTLTGQAQTYGFGVTTTLYDTNVGTPGIGNYTVAGSVGVTTDPEKSGLIADLTNATAATITALRLATAVQQIYEAMGMYGSRYREIIKSLWGTDTSDQAQHIPEFLGSRKTPINMEQVVANTEGTNQDLGSTGAMSLTNDFFHLFTKSFQEHCVILVLNAVRTDAHYAQGLPRQYYKSLKFDYYWNKLAGLSFQPVYTGEVYAVGGDADKVALSFLPAWSEYRNEQDQLTSMFNPDDSLFLQQWTYVNKYNSAPSMGQSFIEEDTTNIDRTLYATSQTTDNFLLDITFIITKVTEVPFYGTPGLTRF